MSGNSNETGIILSALSFAAERHSGQTRKGGMNAPYINHLIGIAYLLWSIGGIRNIEVIVAGILHDTLEDTATTATDITSFFGKYISEIVLEVTDNMSLSKTERRRLQIEHSSTLSYDARLIKLADKISNIQDILASPPQEWSQAECLSYVNWGKSVIDRIRNTNTSLEEMFDSLYCRALEQLGETEN